MTYLNFTKITPAAPNDPFVNVVTHLNNNWDEIDTKLFAHTLMNITLVNPDQGQDFVTGLQKFRIWTGAAYREPDDIDSAWSAWTALPLSGNVAPRVGFTPRWRSNSLLRLVELAGGIQKDGAGSAWPAALVVATTGTSGIANTFLPIGGVVYQQSAAALPTSSTNSAAGWHTIDVSGAWVRIQTRYSGGPGGGNFVMLDGIKWWY